MKSRCRVLIINTNFMTYDGIFSAIINYAENIDKRDIDIDFVSINDPEDSIKKRIKKNNSRLFTLTYRNHNPLKYVIALSKLIKSGNYTLVHVHGSSCIMAVELLASKIAGVPCCPHSHSTNCQHKTAHRILKPVFSILYKNGFACGEAAGKWLYGHKKFDVIKNGIVCEKFRFSEEKRNIIRKELNIPKDAKILLSVAHFSEVKNHAFMIRIMDKILEQDSTCYLVCAGIGEFMEQTKKAIKDRGIEENVRLLGVRQDVPELLSAADALILPSLYEGFPFTLVEAQASGVDCLVSSVVTKECCFSNNMQYIPLKEDYWVEAVMKLKKREDRADISEQNIISIMAAGYDISLTAFKLKELYQKYGKSDDGKRRSD